MTEKYDSILQDIIDPLTVRKFSEQCSISHQEAVGILENYVKSKGAPVWALYEISGTANCSDFPFLPQNEPIVKHLVVPESDVEASKSKFEKVHCTRLHSVQRTNPKDTRVYGRSWDNNDDLKGVVVPQEQQKKAESSVEVKKEKSASPEPSKPVEPSKKTVTQPKKQASVMSMFAKKTETTKARKRPNMEIDEPEEKKPEPKKLTKPAVTQKTPEKRNVFEENKDDDEMPSSREQSVEKEKSPPAKRKKKENNENKNARKKLVVPESESDEEKTVEVKKEKLDETARPNERRRTTRMEKVVETYVDEDGYLVSKEVTKTIECSPQKTPEKPKPKVITAPVPGTAKGVKKNSMITSFFKKQ